MSRDCGVGAIIAVLLVIAGCASAPLDHPKETTAAVRDTSHTLQAKNVARWLGDKTDVNGFYPLNEGFDAFGARLVLMDNAEVSIDVQYFLMKSDLSLIHISEPTRHDSGSRMPSSA